MNLLCFIRKSRTAPDRQHRYRPVLENLEERCVLSAGFAQVNLASDLPGLARIVDPNLINPWGLAFSPTGPFWFANNGSGVSDLLDGRGQAVPLTVNVPATTAASGTPTGVVVNASSGFVISQNGVARPGTFLFDSVDGTISAWNEMV